MEQKFKMQIQRLAKQAAAVLTAVTVAFYRRRQYFHKTVIRYMRQKTAFILPMPIQAIVIRPPVRLKIPAERVRRF